MHRPFEAEVSAPSFSGSPVVPTDPALAKGGEIYQAQACNACHGESAAGTPAGPKLAGIHQRMSAELLSAILKSPSAEMMAGGMTSLDLPPDSMRSLVTSLSRL